MRVTVKSERMRDAFDAGLRSFVTEAKLLAHFNHASLLKAFRLWEANGTAYMAMRYYEGVTLKEALRRLDGPPAEAWLARLLAPLLDAVEAMHAERVYHRDIAPDNILIEPDGRPVLLDFGAARRVIGDLAPALTVIYKPGFAPIEQSAPSPDLAQGPWTDVYALAAVIHYAIGGRTPPPSASRLVRDSMVPARELGVGRFSERFLAAIDAGLAVRPQDRPASIAAFRAALGLKAGGSQPPEPISPEPLPPTEVWPPPDGAPGRGSGAGAGEAGTGPGGTDPGRADARDPLEAIGRALQGGGAGAGGGAHGTDGTLPGRGADDSGGDRGRGARTDIGGDDLGPRRRWLAGASLGVATVALAGGGVALYWKLRGGPAPAPPDRDPRARRDEAPAPPPPAPPPPAPPPFSARAWLDLVEKGASPDRIVRASVPQSRVVIGREIRFGIRSERDGHLVVLLLGTDPSHFYQIFPNAFDADTRIRAGEEIVLGRTPRGGRKWQLAAGGPNPGTNVLVALVSDQPRDFSDVGLVRGDGFYEFDQTVMTRRWNEAPDPAAIVAGRPVCAPGAPCDAAYGAVRFEIDEVVR
jgi:serine/threonine protein kinase